MELPLDHVGIAVPSIPPVQAIYEALTGGASSPPERVETQGVDVVFVGSGTGRLELIAPTRPDTALARFLEKRGAGLHHLAYRVEDIAAALARLEDAGYELIDRAPRPGAGGHLVAFLHPRSTGGILIELVEHGSG